MKFQPHDYQRYCIQKIIDTPKVGLFLDMGRSREDRNNFNGTGLPHVSRSRGLKGASCSA